MRPTSRPQSAIRTPLNRLLATETNVRLLRALVEIKKPLPPSLLASYVRLNLSSVIKALSGLEELGVVEYVGSGGRRPLKFVRNHPLSGALEALFVAERARFDTILKRVRIAAERTSPSPTSVWVEGAVATHKDTEGDPLVVGMLCRTRDLRLAVASFEEELGDLERELDVSIEIRARTNADMLASTLRELDELREALPLLGAPPSAMHVSPETIARKTVSETGPLTHAELEDRARSLAKRVAEMIRADPEIVDRASEHLARQLESPATASDRTTREWERILRTMSLPRLRRFLVDPGERATRLRQSMPFLAVLSDDERRALVAKGRSIARKRR